MKITTCRMNFSNEYYIPEHGSIYKDEFGKMWVVKSHSFNNRFNSFWEVDVETIDEIETLPKKMYCYSIKIVDDDSKTPYSGTIKQSSNFNFFGKLCFEGSGTIKIKGQEKTWTCKHIKKPNENDNVIDCVRIHINGFDGVEKEVYVEFSYVPKEVPVKLIMMNLEKLAGEYA